MSLADRDMPMVLERMMYGLPVNLSLQRLATVSRRIDESFSHWSGLSRPIVNRTDSPLIVKKISSTSFDGFSKAQCTGGCSNEVL